MKKIIIATFIILAVLGISIMSVSAAPDDVIVDGLNTTTNITQALDDAENLNKSLALIFDQDSCYYCDLLKSDTLSDKEVQKILNENYITLIVDINQYPKLAGELQVVGTPTIMLLDSDLNQINRIDGYLPADGFLDEIREI